MGRITRELNEAFDYYSNMDNQKELKKSIISLSESRRSGGDLIPQYSLQSRIRPLFGKEGYNLPSIGDHPDFKHLSHTKDFVYSHIVTLFMDIENSTRLNILYSTEEVHKIKNAFICTAIEIIKSFDGHVHRIMGDAVMAFFGGANTIEFDDIVNAINCATVLQYFSKTVVIPKLKYEDYPFGIRIGIDYGPKEKVYWGSYGYLNMSEVTATSFYVDVASKLQNQAGRNNIMIGDSLKSYIDFPDDLYMIKTDSSGECDYYLKPNLTNQAGMPINYKKYIIDWEKYINLSLISQIEEELLLDVKNSFPISVSSYVYNEKDSVFLYKYLPVSKSLNKDKSIKFKIDLPRTIEYPYTLKFIVENHGAEANEQGGENFGNHEKTYEVDKLNTYDKINHWEVTKYCGLHYMKVKIIKDGSVKSQTLFGVYIK